MSITSGSAPSSASRLRPPANIAPASSTVVTSETCIDAACAARARAGSRAPIARAIRATHASPTANRVDWMKKKNWVAKPTAASGTAAPSSPARRPTMARSIRPASETAI